MNDARRAAVRIATVCALACASGAGHAQYASVNLESSTGVPAVKTMRSFKSMHYVNLVQQEYDFSCGSAALATLLRYGYGIDIPEPEMIKKMMVFSNPETVIKNGFSMLDMKKFVETLGLEGRGFKVDINALYDLKIPVIALIDVNGYQHFVLIKAARDGRIFVSDPALGNRIIAQADFAKQWNGLVLAVIGKPFLEDSPLLKGNESLAVKLRDSALTTGTTATPMVDFGLIRSNLF
ncbi:MULTISPECIES: C39 family peptidase [unclassified Pandoraea]|uniref:C39 family peptidase n=1 Tax=unclassified Pandoraea TaxID=2624094 RepID=UPI002015F5F9|nr:MULTISPECIES: C39 family peptidase [unclassified Pandoraea]